MVDYAAEVPTAAADPSAVPAIALQTEGQNSIVISGMTGPTGGVALRTPGAAVIEVKDTGILISNGQGASIVLTGSVISFNDGQMTVP